MNINGWERLGIVISVAWLIFVVFALIQEIERIEPETWQRIQDPKYSYSVMSQSADGFFVYKKAQSLHQFKPLEEEKDSGDSDKNTSGSKIEFDDLIPPEGRILADGKKVSNVFDQFDLSREWVVEFRLLRFLSTIFIPILLLWLIGYAFVWVKSGFQYPPNRDI